MKKIYSLIAVLLIAVVVVCFALRGRNKQIALRKEQANEIVLYNWEDYTDLSVLEDFEKEFGIKVVLKEYDTAYAMVSEIQSNPGKYDIIITDSPSVSTLIKARLLAELDLGRLPNFKFIKEEFKNPPYDPENKYSVPYLWGTAGLVINTNFIPEDADSWAILWDGKNKGKIALLDDPREAMTAVLGYSNFSLSTKNPEELKIAEKNALLLKENRVQFGDTFENLERVMNGELWVAQVYNGDVVYKAGDRKDIKYILPREGANKWIDNYVVSIDSTKKEEAHKLINFLLRPDISARVANKFSYATPNKDAEAMIDPDMLSNPVIYPPASQLRNCEYLHDIGEAQSEYNRIYSLMK